MSLSTKMQEAIKNIAMRHKAKKVTPKKPPPKKKEMADGDADDTY